MKKPLPDGKAAIKRYADLLADIKSRIRQGQHRAVMSANEEMLHMYWDIGRMVAAKQDAQGWDAAVIPRLAVDLPSDMPEIKGFSERNIRRMIQFYKEYIKLLSIWPRPVAKLKTNDALPAAQTVGGAPRSSTGRCATAVGPQCHPQWPLPC
jgi:hypothetical protein